MDDLARISVDDQTETQRREARKFLTALADDVNTYHARLSDRMSADLRERLTQDFGCKWHTYQLEDAEIDLSVLYAGEDGE